MKKLFLFLSLSLLISVSSAQDRDDSDTIIKLQTEQNLSQRVEELLFPFVGKTVVVVDLKLSYPSFSLSDFQSSTTNADLSSSRKKADIISEDIEKMETNRIKILSKKVTIYLSDKIDRQMEDFVRINVKKWLKLDTSKSDRLSLSKTLSTKETRKTTTDEDKDLGIIEKTDSEEFQPAQFDGTEKNIYIIVLIALIAILVLILLLMNFSFRTGLKTLSKSIGSLNIGRAGGANLSAKLVQAKAPSILEDSKRNPLQINILEQDKTKEVTIDFSFLENLEISSLIEILKKESSKDIAYILSSLSVDYAKNFFNEFTDNTDEIINVLLSDFKISKEDAEALQKKLFEKYKKFLSEESMRTDGKTALINFVNNLPLENSKKLYDKIEEVNSEIGKELRNKIFMFDDLTELDDNDIVLIINNLEHNSLVSFMKSVKYEIREKFFRNMSERVASMFREDLEILNELSEEEKAITIDNVFNAIREILKYK